MKIKPNMQFSPLSACKLIGNKALKLLFVNAFVCNLIQILDSVW